MKGRALVTEPFLAGTQGTEVGGSSRDHAVVKLKSDPSRGPYLSRVKIRKRRQRLIPAVPSFTVTSKNTREEGGGFVEVAVLPADAPVDSTPADDVEDFAWEDPSGRLN